jgi:hypothetical protein
MKKAILIPLINIFIFVNLYSQILPPSPYLNYKLNKRKYVNFDQYIKDPSTNLNTLRLKEFPTDTPIEFSYGNSPIVIVLEESITTPPCSITEYINGLLKVSLSVSNNENNLSQIAENYTNSIYEHGKHKDNPNEFNFDLKVNLEIKALSDINVLKTYEVELEINSEVNSVKQTKVIEESFIYSGSQIDAFYVSKINVVRQNKTSNLLPNNIFIELKADYDYFIDFQSNNPTQLGSELYEIPFLTINGNTLDCHQYYVALNETNELPLPNQPITNWYIGSIVNINPDKLFVWRNNSTLCPNLNPYLFQIQILRLLNNKSKLESEFSINTTIDWSKALTLELNPDDCKISGQPGYYQLKGFIPTEGTGYYVWRVRPIGNKYEGGLNNVNNLGRWSSYIQVDEFGNTLTNTENNYKHYYNDNDVIQIRTNNLLNNGIRENVLYLKTDDALNWQHTRIYTEGNRNQSQFHDIIEYYNSNLLPVQTQKRLPSSRNVILTHRDYDMQNRVAIQTLPISINKFGFTNGNNPFPFNSTTTIANLNYKTNVLYGLNDQNSYNYLTYDGAYGTTPSLSNGLLNEYYNGDNILGTDISGFPLYNFTNIPSAEGFPFTRTIYSNDGLNRVVEQSLPGKLHRVRDELDRNSILESDSKTVRNFITGASKVELYSMFGKEAPHYSSVLKEINVDPNNIVSFTFKDFNGKVIATSLGWNSTHPNLISLDMSDGATIFNKGITNQFSEYVRVEDKIITNGGIFIVDPTIVTVKEEIKVLPFKFFSNYCPTLPSSLQGFKVYPNIVSNSKLNNPKSTLNPPTPAVNTLNQNNRLGSSINTTLFQDSYSYDGVTSSSSNLAGEFNLRSEIYIDGLNTIKDQLLLALKNHISDLKIQLKIDELIILIDQTMNTIATAPNQGAAKFCFDEFKNKLKEEDGFGWIKTTSTVNQSTSTYTLSKPQFCININVPDFDCDESSLESMYIKLINKYAPTQTNTNPSTLIPYDFSADILNRIYNKYKGRILYYTDIESMNLLDGSEIKSLDNNPDMEKLSKFFKIEDNYVTYETSGKPIIHDNYKNKLTFLFYQFGFKLDYPENQSCSTDVATPFYDRINILINNFLNLGTLNNYNYTTYPLPHKVSRYIAVDDFIKKFTDLAIREATNTPNVNNSKNIDIIMKNLVTTDDKDFNYKPKLYIDNKINILDNLFNTTNRSLIGYSNCKTQYIEEAYAYIKNPEILKYTLNAQESEIFNNYPRDAWKPIEDSDILIDKCASNNLTNLKSKELAYINIDRKIKGKIYQVILENQINDINTTTDQSVKDIYYQKGTTLIDYNIYSWKSGDHNGSELEILEEIIQSTKGICENYKPVFEKALRIFFATNSFSTYIEDEVYKYDQSQLSTMRKITLSDLDKLVNVLKIDCELKTKILPSQIESITPPPPSGERKYRVNLTSSQEYYLDALYNNKNITVDKISFPTKLVKPSQEPPSNNCRFTAQLGQVEISPELKKYYAESIVKQLNKKLEEMKENLYVGTPYTKDMTASLDFNKYIASPEFRAKKYREIIDYLNNTILPQSNIFENYYYHNSDYISSNSCIGDFKNFEDLSSANNYCNDYFYPYSGIRFNYLIRTPVNKNEYQIYARNFSFEENWWDFENQNYFWEKEPRFMEKADNLVIVTEDRTKQKYNSIGLNYGTPIYLRPKSRMFLITPDNDYLKTNVFLKEYKNDKIGRPENIQKFTLVNEIIQREFIAGTRQFTNRSNFITNQGNKETKSGYLINFNHSYLEDIATLINSTQKYVNDNNTIDWRNYQEFLSFESIFLVDKTVSGISDYTCDEFFTNSAIDTDPNPNCRIVYSFDLLNIASNNNNTLANKITNLCYMSKLTQIKQAVISQVTNLKTNLENEILNSFDSYAKNLDKNVSKTVSISYNHKMQQFTLYYYDKAGNLVRTVPPKGVSIIASTDINVLKNTLPAHKFVTHYKYNANGQVVRSDSPDETEFNYYKYSKKGFLKFSQSAKQKATNAISYLKYDDRMRITETGELTAITPSDLFSDISESNPNTFFNSTRFIRNFIEDKAFPITANFILNTTTPPYSDNKISISYPNGIQPPLNGNYTAELKRSFVITTDYSLDQNIPSYYGVLPVRTYLRNKVNHTVRDEDGNFQTRGDQVGTYYSYDAHGNVNFIIQDIPVNEDGSVRMFPKTEYEYDLISKKVRKVKYNEGQSDSYIQEYIYDEDNRLVKVKTSRYGYEWEIDASYKYAPHGPLARVEIGHDNLQGIDYTYTIQGWLKAINNVNSQNPQNENNDPGLDGLNPPAFLFKRFPYDAYSEVLNYYKYTDGTGEQFDDFITNKGASTGFNKDFFTGNRLTPQSAEFRSLFNGNIASWSSDYTSTNTNDQTNMDYTFRYDILNRLIKADAHTRDNLANPTWSGKMDNYSNNYTYDRNGNILNLQRYNNSTSKIDDMNYQYQTGSNKLSKISDNIPSSTVDYDIDAQPNNNYQYDASGNLTQDIAEGISPNSITWTVDGKVSTIYKNKPGEQPKWIKYLYDASGNRVAKMIRNQIPNSNPPSYNPILTEYTLYARDANSQVMAVYERKPVTQEPFSVTSCLKLKLTKVKNCGGDVPYSCTYTHEFTLCNDDFEYISHPNEYSKYKMAQIRIKRPIVSPPLSGVCSHPTHNCWGNITIDLSTNTVIGYREKLNDYNLVINPNGNYEKYDVKISGVSFRDNTGALLGYDEVEARLKAQFEIQNYGHLPKLSEWHIYGNAEQGRFAIKKPDNGASIYYLGPLENGIADKKFSRILGSKEYELKDHLGNVRVAITDFKQPATLTQARGVQPFIVDERSVNDYYPYGMLIPERSWSSSDYRYGYNTQEKSLEIDANGNHTTAEFWEYDSRRAGRWNPDPVVKPDRSDYSVFSNNPITNSDVQGDDDVSKIIPGSTYTGPPMAIVVRDYFYTKYVNINKRINKRVNESDDKSKVHTAQIVISSVVKEIGGDVGFVDSYRELTRGRDLDGSNISTAQRALAGVFLAIDLSSFGRVPTGKIKKWMSRDLILGAKASADIINRGVHFKWGKNHLLFKIENGRVGLKAAENSMTERQLKEAMKEFKDEMSRPESKAALKDSFEKGFEVMNKDSDVYKENKAVYDILFPKKQ